MRRYQAWVFMALFLSSWSVFAQGQQIDSTVNMLQASMGPSVNKLTATAISWLGAFAVLQWVMTNYSVLKSGGDVQTLIAKSAGLVAWIAICLYLINNAPLFISRVGSGLFSILGVELVGPGTIVASGIGMAGILVGLAIASGAASNTAGLLLLILALAVAGVAFYFACKIFMIQMEVGLVAMMAPLSFSFLGLSALRDQGIAPFKALISLAYRIVTLTLVISAFSEVANVLSATLDGISWEDFLPGSGGITKVLSASLGALGAYAMLAYLLYKSDSIAASLSSGSTNMGTGDVASAAAAGAAIGAAIVSGGAGGAGALSQLPKSMSEFMKGLGSPGTVTNALGSGMGGGDAPPIPPSDPVMSLASTQGPASANTGRFDGTTRGMSRADASKLAVQAPFGTFDQSESSPPSAAAPAASSPTGGTNTSNSIGQDSRPGSGSSPTATSGAASKEAMPLGSGLNEGIAGPGSSLESTLSDLNKTLASQQQRRKPGFRERLGDANREISREQAGTSVSINPSQTE